MHLRTHHSLTTCPAIPHGYMDCAATFGCVGAIVRARRTFYCSDLATLSESDVRQILAFLYQAGEVDGPQTFTEPVLDAFFQLFPGADHAAGVEFGGRDPAVALDELTVLSFSEVQCEWCVNVEEGSWSPEIDEAARDCADREEPVQPVPRFLDTPVRFSDVMTTRQFHSTQLWATVHRVLGIEDGLCLWLTVPGEALLHRIGFAASRRGRFRERDVLVLKLLAPHLRQFYRRAAVRRAPVAAAESLTGREREVLLLVAQGKRNGEIARLLWLSPATVRTHLEHVFDKLSVKTRAAAVARVLAASSVAAENGSDDGLREPTR
jgi:DNA-binding CsgD family transcriptional regulator